MKRRIKVLYVTAEAAPYAQVGGLGEVGGSLPLALAEQGVDVRRIMPRYDSVQVKMRYQSDLPVPMGDEYETCVLKTHPASKKVPTYFVENARFFKRNSIYSQPDDGHRFFFFCRAVVEMLKRGTYKPDIVHVHDWHMGFLPLLLKKEFPKIKTIMTIHNLNYSGFIPAVYLNGLLTDRELFRLGWPEWLDFMKAGLLYADRINTVSPGYSKEMLCDRDHPMYQLLHRRTEGILGILNGIDTEVYNPTGDGVNTFSYDSKSVEKKRKNKELLQKELGLKNIQGPLISLVTRLEDDKGIGLLIKALPGMEIGKFQLCILGTGNPYYQELLSSLATKYPGCMVFIPTYSPEMAKKIYAASDVYLMPSRVEPCGIGQMIAMRYGAVPLVTAVGGLKDSVVDVESAGKPNGLYIHEWSCKGIIETVHKAVSLYETSKWGDLVRNAMQSEFSWRERSLDYLKLYHEVVQNGKQLK